MKKINKLILTAAMAAMAVVSVCSMADDSVYAAAKDGETEIAINSRNFPDKNLREKVKKQFDSDGNKKLSKSELGKVKKITIKWMPESFKGLEYFYNLESFYYDRSFYDTGKYGGKQRLTIDLSKNKKLKKVEIYDWYNVVKAVNIKGCKGIKEFQCIAKINTIDLSDCKKLKELYLSEFQGTKVDLSQGGNIIELNVHGKNIKSISLKKCKKLTKVYMSGLKLSSLDLTQNKNIKSLSVIESSVKNIALGDKRKIYDCHIESDNLKTIDLDRINPVVLTIKSGGIKKLDITHMTNLKQLFLENFNITSLDVSKNTKLNYLILKNFDLKKLDVSINTSLLELNCENSRLKTINLSKNKKLRRLYLGGNQINELDVSKLKDLQILDIQNNKVSTIDLSNNKKLTNLNCSSNIISKLDISANKKLNTLDCSDNSLDAIDITCNKYLYQFNCRKNEIKELDVRGSKYYRYDAEFETDKTVKLIENKERTAEEIYDVLGIEFYWENGIWQNEKTVYVEKGCENLNAGDFLTVKDGTCRTEYEYPLSLLEVKGVKYYSSNQNIVSVDERTGDMKALKSGEATITIDWFGEKYNARFKVVKSLNHNKEKKNIFYEGYLEVVEKLKKACPEAKLNENTYTKLVNVIIFSDGYYKGAYYSDKKLCVYDPYAYKLFKMGAIIDSQHCEHTDQREHKFKVKSINATDGKVTFKMDRTFTYEDALYFNCDIRSIKYKEYDGTYKKPVKVTNTATRKSYSAYVIFKVGSSKAELKLKNGEKLQSGVKYTQKPTYMQWLRGSKKEFTMK